VVESSPAVLTGSVVSDASEFCKANEVYACA
jgi:hypothetical protein